MRNLEKDAEAASLTLARIDGALARATEGLAESESRDFLYHYTSSEGFRGIVEGNNLRFSDPLFLNDGSEVHYANNLLIEAVENLQGLKSREHQFARIVADRIQTTALQHRPLIFCLSKEPDLLNQWRDYGRDIVPYCIELATDVLRAPDWSFSCQIVKMIYDRTEQRLILSNLLWDMISIFRENKRVLFSQTFAGQTLDAALSEVWGALITFKNPAFAAEQEWRLLAYPSEFGRQRPKFRSGPLGVVPFYERLPRLGLLLPITRVWVGPSPFSSVTQHSSSIFLHAHGYEVPVEGSTIPAR